MPGWAALTVSILLNAFAQLSVKLGADRLKDIEGDGVVAKLLSAVVNAPFVFVGIVLYGLSFVFWTYTLSKHELSYAYPMVAVGYALVLFLSWVVLSEQITMLRVVGTLVICVGVVIVSRT